jgi:ribosome-interacting GTPase 1
MPTNLPPDYFEIEKRFRSAESITERIACLQEMLSVVPKHKGTDHLRADLRRKLSKLKAESRSRKGASRRESAFHIDREGAGQVAVIGPTNVGKSSLVCALTNATPEVSAAPFATWQPTPGMMPIEDIQVQLVDTPPLSRDYVEPALMDLIRRSDMILLVVDLQTHPVEQLENTLAILEEHRIVPLCMKKRFGGQDRLLFKPLLVLANKADDEESDELFTLFLQLLERECPAIPVSATTGRSLEHLKQIVFERLEIVRVYAKPPGKDADLSAPFVIERGSTVEDFARSVHQDFYEKLTAARVWGSSVFDGQMVPRDYVLHDGDVVELRI